MLVQSAVLCLALFSNSLAAKEQNADKKRNQSAERRVQNGGTPQKRGLYDPVEILSAPPLPPFSSYPSSTIGPPLEYSSLAAGTFKSTSPYPEVIIKPSSTVIAHASPYDEIHGSSLPPIVSSTHLPPLSPSPSPPPPPPSHHGHIKEITITKEIPVPFYVHVEKKVPYPVYIQVPHPYPVTVEKRVPYEVRVPVQHPVPVAVPVPRPYPVHVEKHVPVPVPVEKRVPYPVRVPVDRPYPVHVPVERPVPYAVEKPVPYPVQVLVDRPVPVEKHIPYPYPVKVPVPVAYEKHYQHYQDEPYVKPAYQHAPYHHAGKYAWSDIFKRNARH